MGKQDELNKLYRSIKDSEVRMNTFAVNMATIQKEMNFHINTEKQLEENLTYLKSIKVIALATEYKKTKEDMGKTKKRLSDLRNDMASNKKAYRDTEVILKKNKDAYDKLTEASENNVIEGKFGKDRV